GRLPRRRAYPGLAGVGRNRDQDLAHVVGVIRLRQLMTDLVSVGVNLLQKAAGLAGNGSEGRIHRDANDVVSWRHNRLPIAAVKNKKLPAQEEPVSVCPSMADALVPGNSHGAAIPELRAPGRLSSVSGRHGISIQHAKALLG